MIAVIFEVTPTAEGKAEYLKTGAELPPLRFTTHSPSFQIKIDIRVNYPKTQASAGLKPLQ